MNRPKWIATTRELKWHLAYHEAAHAVTSDDLGNSVAQVAVKGSKRWAYGKEPDQNGHVYDDCKDPWQRMIIASAGPIGSDLSGLYHKDYFDLLGEESGDRNHIDLMIHQLEPNLFVLSQHQEDHIMELYRYYAQKAAKTILEANKDKVDRVAKALMHKGLLTQRMFKKLV